MTERLEKWLFYLNMTFDGSYKSLTQRIHEFYERQKLVQSSLLDPLSNEPNNIWSISLQNSKVLREIQMDARRVFADQPLFQTSEILQITEEVLFTWSKQHEEGYQQGMLYILVYNSTSLDHFADSYMIFDRILGLGLIFYFKKSPGFLKRKCEVIINYYLKAVDVEFFIILEKAGVDLTIVLMRWLRCMLAKEFYFEEVLNIWDFIIEKQQSFISMDMVVLAMLVWARDFGKIEVVKGETCEVLPVVSKLSFKGHGKVILFLANKFYRFIILNKYEDRYLIPKIRE